MRDLRAEPTQVLEHPATRAWLALHPKQGPPRRITTLKPEYRKSSVYRLEGFAKVPISVVAKRCESDTAVVEDTVYREILPKVPYPTLRYFGSFYSREVRLSWLFIEYAAGVRYSSGDYMHRKLAAEWMALLHTSTAPLGETPTLPPRDSVYYHGLLLAAQDTLRIGLKNPNLETQQAELLQALSRKCGAFESHWPDIVDVIDQAPRTLVHGGFYGKNVRVLDGDHRPTLAVFDWESAGWGIPIIDLALIDTMAYEISVGSLWPQLPGGFLSKLAAIGRFLGAVKAIPGESKSLARAPLHRVLGKFEYYYSVIEEAFRDLGWKC